MPVSDLKVNVLSESERFRRIVQCWPNVAKHELCSKHDGTGMLAKGGQCCPNMNGSPFILLHFKTIQLNSWPANEWVFTASIPRPDHDTFILRFELR